MNICISPRLGAGVEKTCVSSSYTGWGHILGLDFTAGDDDELFVYIGGGWIYYFVL